MSLEGNKFLRRAEQTRDAQLGRTPVEAAGQSIGEVADEPEFRIYLESLGANPTNAAMWGRYKNGETTEADMPKLTSQYKQYLERKKNVESLLSTLSDYMDDMVSNCQEFRDISHMYGAASVQFVLQQGLREMMMKNPQEFVRIQAEYKKLRDFEENIEKPMDKKIKDWCEKNGVPEDEDLRQILTDPSGPLQRRDMIQERLKHNLSFKGLLVDWVKQPFGAGTRARASELARVDVLGAITQREGLTKSAGMFARDLLVKNKEFREALSRIQVGKEPPFARGAETKMSMREATGSVKKSEVITAWNQFLVRKNITNTSNISASDLQDAQDEFLDDYPDEYFKTQKEGFWQAVKRIFFRKTLKDPKVRSWLK